MRIRYDREVDALYVQLGRSKIVESDEVRPGIIVDFNAREQIVGIEVLDFKRRVPTMSSQAEDHGPIYDGRFNMQERKSLAEENLKL